MGLLYVIAAVVGAMVLSFLAFIMLRALRGLSVAKHLYAFGLVYDTTYEDTGSTHTALREAFGVFHTCPGFKDLTNDEVESALAVLSLAPDPKWIVEKIVLKFDSKNLVRACRDTGFLRKVVDVGIRRG